MKRKGFELSWQGAGEGVKGMGMENRSCSPHLHGWDRHVSTKCSCAPYPLSSSGKTLFTDQSFSTTSEGCLHIFPFNLLSVCVRSCENFERALVKWEHISDSNAPRQLQNVSLLAGVPFILVQLTLCALLSMQLWGSMSWKECLLDSSTESMQQILKMVNSK